MLFVNHSVQVLAFTRNSKIIVVFSCFSSDNFFRWTALKRLFNNLSAYKYPRIDWRVFTARDVGKTHTTYLYNQTVFETILTYSRLSNILCTFFISSVQPATGYNIWLALARDASAIKTTSETAELRTVYAGIQMGFLRGGSRRTRVYIMQSGHRGSDDGRGSTMRVRYEITKIK